MLDTQEGGCVNYTRRGHTRGIGARVSQLAMGRNQRKGSEFNIESGKDEVR